MRDADVATAFATAAVEFEVQAKNAGAELIGHAHTLFFQRTRMSPSQIALEIENIREAMFALNTAFTKLDFAQAAMTVGETASRIRAAVTTPSPTA